MPRAASSPNTCSSATGSRRPETLVTKRDLYEVEGDELTRKRKACPKCGDGVFMAEHGDRVACGRCGYTEFND